MGVSLERVQFKFASIIGELCSEPVVLSQFAVWLDLRLAEYKSKGAISLDCSGEKPDPSWLKGLRTVTAPAGKKVLGSRLTPRASPSFSRGGMYSRSSAFHRRSLNSHSKFSTPRSQTSMQRDSDRLSAGDSMDRTQPLTPNQGSEDVVLIKDEPVEDSDSPVYPVSLHPHQAESDSRKRPASDVSSDSQNNSTTSYKVRKTPPEDTSLNQSLMSVLGSSFDDQNADLTSGVNESASEMDYSVNLQNQTGESGPFPWGDNSAGAFHSSAANTSTTSTYSPNRPSVSATITSNSSLTEGMVPTDTDTQGDGSELLMDQAFGEKSLHTYEVMYSSVVFGGDTQQSSSAQRLSQSHLNDQRMNSITTKKRSTAGNLVYAVRTFERWLQRQSEQDHRKIEMIPPVELDSYLVKFFGCVRNVEGKDYSSESFRILRANINSYLKEQGYPVSITTSAIFASSQEAFLSRKLTLKTKERELKVHRQKPDLT